jgi:hypothetical protein
MGDPFCLKELAEAGYLYSAAGSLTSTALLGAQFALVNSGSKGYPLRVFGLKVTTTAVSEANLFGLDLDPALAVLNPAVNRLLKGPGSEAIFEGAVAAAPAALDKLVDDQIAANNDYELIGPGLIYLPSGKGLLLSTPAVVATISAWFLWAEIPPAWFDD